MREVSALRRFSRSSRCGFVAMTMAASPAWRPARRNPATWLMR
jgi:hypothetical protein